MLNSSLTAEDLDHLKDYEGIWRLRTTIDFLGYYEDFVTIVKFESACNTPRLSSLIDGRPTVSIGWSYSGEYNYSNPASMAVL